MAKVLRCRDLGFDCNGVVRAETDEEVLQQAVTHARDVHGLEAVPDGMAQSVAAAIREEPTPPAGR